MEVFKAELFALLRATIMIGDQVEDKIRVGIQKITIFTDSQAMVNRIPHNEGVKGQTWASAIIRSTEEIWRV
jgi:ribonuclease HI